MTSAKSIKKRCFAAFFAASALALAGCGESQDESNRVVEDGTLATRWSSSQYTVALFAVHCEKVAAGRDGAKRSVLESSVDDLVDAASLSTTDRQREYANATLTKSADAIHCEPDLAQQLFDAEQ